MAKRDRPFVSTDSDGRLLGVSVLKECEGGPYTGSIRQRAADFGCKVTVSNSGGYVGHKSITLVEGKKKDFKRLLREFCCDYIN